MYNMLKMKKMNGLKIFTLVLLSLSKFETMFGMMGFIPYQFYTNNENGEKTKQKENNLVKENKMLNENYFLVDDEDNIIFDPKNGIFSFYLANGLPENFSHAFVKENEKKKFFVCSIENTDFYIVINDKKIPVEKVNGGFRLILDTNEKIENPEDSIKCKIVKKNVSLDRLNVDYCLENLENNKIETIHGKNVSFKVLTRCDCLTLKKTIKNAENFLKNDKGNILVNEENKPLLFKEVENNVILYVKQKGSALSLAVLTDTESIENNSFKVKIIKNSEINENNENNKVPENNKNNEENEDFPCCNC